MSKVSDQVSTAVEQSTAEPITAVAEFNSLTAQLNELELRFKDVVFDCSTKAGMADAKKARAEIRETRFAIQNAEKTVIVPYQDAVKEAQKRVNEVKAYGSGLVSQVFAIETPIHEAIKAEEDRIKAEKEQKAQEERARVEAIQRKIAYFSEAATKMAGASSEDIYQYISRIEAAEISVEIYAEFAADAAMASKTALNALKLLHSQAVQRELAEAQQKAMQAQMEAMQKENARLQAEQEKAAAAQREAFEKEKAEFEAERQRMERERERMEREREKFEAEKSLAPAPAPEETPPSVSSEQPAEADESVAGKPSAQTIVECVALSFDVSEEIALSWLKATKF